ncbi:TlpA family protein disulfide reductase, partial [Bacteroidota bacterium]
MNIQIRFMSIAMVTGWFKIFLLYPPSKNNLRTNITITPAIKGSVGNDTPTPNSFLDIIYNNDDISFRTLAQSPQKSASFSKSQENIILYDYLHKKNDYLQKIDLLEPLIVNYPESDPFYNDVLIKYESLNNEFDTYINTVKDNAPLSLTSLFITFDKPLPLNMKLAVDEQEAYIKNNYFSGLTYDDPRLLKLNILPNKIIGYLSLYRNQSYSKEEQEASFIEAVDSIVFHMMDNEDIYNYSLQYLIEGFEAFGFDNVVSHIANTYSPVESCINEKRKSELEKRIENIKKLSVGNAAPNIQFGSNRNDNLDDLKNKYNLVFFWSTWCPHCK